MTRSRALILMGLAVAVAGCGNDPYAQPDRSHDPEPPPGEQPAPPLPKPIERVSRPHLAPTPEQAARRAAELTTNWTGQTVVRQYAAFARLTVGEARRQARQSAARLPTDPQLAATGSRSTGTVEVVANRTGSRARRLVIVTYEIVTADGLRDERWRVTLATAERRRDGWVISRWEPQP
jgi:hypothetical protein